MIKLDKLFDVRYGVNLELNKMRIDSSGVNFVSRSSKNNGVSAKVALLPDVNPICAGVLTVAGGGSVLETFLQPEPFYSGRDLYYLVPRVIMSDAQKLFYCACIRANRYRYSYGRQANRTLKEILVPSLKEIPSWVHGANINAFQGADSPAHNIATPNIHAPQWRNYKLSDLFDIRKGKRLTKADMIGGSTPFIGSTDSKNGVTAFVGQDPIHEGNTISVAYNGSVAETFYQPVPFWATDDVNVLYPKFQMSSEVALFICVIIRQEKYRFNYGRKWHLDRMKSHEIKLPVKKGGGIDFLFMEKYIKSLPYSSQVETLNPQDKIFSGA